MSTIDKISQLLKEQGKKQKELTDYIGVSKNSFTDWKSGRINSYVKHIPKIAEFLGVSTDYLIGTEKEKPISITSDEPMNQLWAKYSHLSASDKKTIDDMFDFLLSKPEYSEKENVG